MRFAERLFKRCLLPVALTIAGCSGGGGSSSSGVESATAGASSGAAASSAGGGGTTTQSLATSTGAASSTGGGSSTGAATTSGGSSTGASKISFVDGGYVACSIALAADAGPDGDGGPAHWLCQPGTYTCDLTGNIGNCFQCQSDSDCGNRQLPTYDPGHPHCDLGSGIVGYQNFCQECVADTDCSSNAAGHYCDLNPTYPSGSSQPPIEDLGFEHCGTLLTDCRIDGGPGCVGIDSFCNKKNGVCETNPGTCVNDQDCDGLVSPYNAYLPEPFCVKGACNTCAGGQCPNAFCSTAADCGNPNNLPTGLLCDLTTYQCSCTDSSQCGGFWPVCEGLDGSRVNDAGQTLGTCGCDATDECDDAGLICLPPSKFAPMAVSSCGLSCTNPEFPACRSATYSYPVCNPATGACGPCTQDDQCRNGVQTGGPLCDFSSGGQGNCGCLHDSDCAIGQTCQAGTFLGQCTATLPRCSTGSCGSYFCDWDAGTCLNNLNPLGLPSCITDYDCAAIGALGAMCEKGQCIECNSNADCLTNGYATYGGTTCCVPGNKACAASLFANNTCEDVCLTNPDCTGNPFGPSCVQGDAGGAARCGCGADVDCSGSSYGAHCNTDPTDLGIGICNCQSDSDCPSGNACQIFSGFTYGFCSSFCFGGDAGLYPCLPNYFCDPSSNCRPRCDDANTCQGDDMVCDTGNVAGQNGLTINGPSSGVTWCYPCAQASDCGAGLGCNPLHGCGTCAGSSDCPAGTACIDGGICQPTCASSACPEGLVCDTFGVAGFGPNVCYQCISPADCPNGEGCDDLSHTCGSCFGPNASGGPFDCPPDAICSNYWSPERSYTPGVCLASCDRESCPASEPICAVYPGLTPDHKYCFGCLQDSDCADAGPGTRCNLAPHTTFTCISGP